MYANTPEKGDITSKQPDVSHCLTRSNSSPVLIFFSYNFCNMYAYKGMRLKASLLQKYNWNRGKDNGLYYTSSKWLQKNSDL